MVKQQGKRECQYHVWPEYNEGDIRGITFMFCSNCGKEIRDNSNFCPYCGSVKRVNPSEAVKQTPVQDTSVSVKKNGSKAFKFCPNCGKAIGENSDFCPYCGSVKRTIPSKTVEQTSAQNTSAATWQNRFKNFLRRKWSEDKNAMVVIPLLVLSIVCIVVYCAKTNVYIGTLANDCEKFVGRDIRIDGWVEGRSEENPFFVVCEMPSGNLAKVLVYGGALENLPEDGDAVALRGEWVTDGEFCWLEADKAEVVTALTLLEKHRDQIPGLLPY